jgi:lipoprotein-releasing system permease protein
MKTRNVNLDIALTHLLTRKRQTLIAAMGVTIGIALYIFSTSLISGFSAYSRAQTFKTVPHIRMYKEDQVSKPLFTARDTSDMVVVINPKLTATTKNIINPYAITVQLQAKPFVVSAAPQVNVDLFYTSGRSQLKGVATGVNIIEADAMFDIRSTMVGGSLQDLESDLNGIIVGSGVADKMNVGLGDNLSVTSSWGVFKVLRVVGIFSIGNKNTDQSKSYINVATAQQLMREGPNFVTDIYVSVADPDSSLIYARQLQQSFTYKVEDWQTSNADTLATDKLTALMNNIVSIAIMMVAAFGIYNILNMTITQKLNDIAILKAAGFKGKHIIRIFLTEAFIMGIIGTVGGLTLGLLLNSLLSRVYIGPPVGYFPVIYSLKVFGIGAGFGMLMSLGAGYFPARKAARVDPVEIFRK